MNPRRAAALAAVTLGVAVASTACGAAGGGDAGGGEGRPLLVVTTNILGDVVGEVVGDQAEVLVLLPPLADPHSFQPSAAQAAQASGADLLVANGLGLEGGMASTLEALDATGVPVVEVGPALDPLTYGVEAGDDDASPDPHVWTDPLRMVRAVEVVADAVVAEVEGIDEERLRAEAAGYAGQLRAADAEAEQLLAAVPDQRRRLVTDHHVFAYFADRYDFEVVGAVLPSGSTLASPSAADLEELATTIRDTGVPALFADASRPARLTEALAGLADVRVEVVSLFTESLTPPDGEAPTYLDLVTENARRIADALAPDPAATP